MIRDPVGNNWNLLIKILPYYLISRVWKGLFLLLEERKSAEIHFWFNNEKTNTLFLKEAQSKNDKFYFDFVYDDYSL